MIERLLAAENALVRGDLDVAERLFTSVADADARNAIAVVGLARVAVERGKGEEAIATLRRALEIDPDEAAALRLLRRWEAEPVMPAIIEAPIAAPRTIVPPAVEPVEPPALPPLPIVEPPVAQPVTSPEVQPPVDRPPVAHPPVVAGPDARRAAAKALPRASRPSLLDRFRRWLRRSGGRG